MQYISDGDLYKVVKITGPKHNMLALCFGDIDSKKPIEITVLKNENDISKISSSEVKRQVLSGIKEINEELKTNYNVIKIQFVSSDSPSDVIYSDLSKEIVRRLEADGEFKRI